MQAETEEARDEWIEAIRSCIPKMPNVSRRLTKSLTDTFRPNMSHKMGSSSSSHATTSENQETIGELAPSVLPSCFLLFFVQSSRLVFHVRPCYLTLKLCSGCLVLSCLVLSCLVLSCLVLSCRRFVVVLSLSCRCLVVV